MKQWSLSTVFPFSFHTFHISGRKKQMKTKTSVANNKEQTTFQKVPKTSGEGLWSHWEGECPKNKKIQLASTLGRRHLSHVLKNGSNFPCLLSCRPPSQSQLRPQHLVSSFWPLPSPLPRCLFYPFSDPHRPTASTAVQRSLYNNIPGFFSD